jgi:hypothetical protein
MTTDEDVATYDRHFASFDHFAPAGGPDGCLTDMVAAIIAEELSKGGGERD